jgi:SAM-dependent methyltransferase
MPSSSTGVGERAHQTIRRARNSLRKGREIAVRALSDLGLGQSEAGISADSQRYWQDSARAGWTDNSHWRDSSVFAATDLWARIGREHLDLFDKFARAVDFTRPLGRVVEWGCGGGANAVRFAPRAEEFIGVDIAAETLDECARQVAATCDTRFRPVRIDVTDPEGALRQIGEPCDVFLCFYVFELLPTPAYGERVLRIAHELLAPGGLAIIQIKYDDGNWLSKPRRRFNASAVADLTTYSIPSFWSSAQRHGFTPELVHLVPANELDRRYAYFLLSRPRTGPR